VSACCDNGSCSDRELGACNEIEACHQFHPGLDCSDPSLCPQAGTCFSTWHATGHAEGYFTERAKCCTPDGFPTPGGDCTPEENCVDVDYRVDFIVDIERTLTRENLTYADCDGGSGTIGDDNFALTLRCDGSTGVSGIPGNSFASQDAEAYSTLEVSGNCGALFGGCGGIDVSDEDPIAEAGYESGGHLYGAHLTSDLSANFSTCECGVSMSLAINLRFGYLDHVTTRWNKSNDFSASSELQSPTACGCVGSYEFTGTNDDPDDGDGVSHHIEYTLTLELS
jgi:hypothetical protein